MFFDSAGTTSKNERKLNCSNVSGTLVDLLCVNRCDNKLYDTVENNNINLIILMVIIWSRLQPLTTVETSKLKITKRLLTFCVVLFFNFISICFLNFVSNSIWNDACQCKLCNKFIYLWDVKKSKWNRGTQHIRIEQLEIVVLTSSFNLGIFNFCFLDNGTNAWQTILVVMWWHRYFENPFLELKHLGARRSHRTLLSHHID